MPHPQKVTISVPRKSGILADYSTWTMYYDRGIAPVAADYDNWRDNFKDFLRTVATGAALSVQQLLAPCIGTAVDGWVIRFYDIPAVKGPLGSPVATRATYATSNAANGLPAEVAVTLSYQRAYGSDVEFGAGGTRPRASDRGRIYLGPLSTGVGVEDATTKTHRPDPATCGVFNKAAHQFLKTAMDADSWTWLQFSEALWDYDAVTSCWVDDAWDIQRRRGVDPTVKTVETF